MWCTPSRPHRFSRLAFRVLLVFLAAPASSQTVANFDDLPVPFPDFVLPTREPFEYQSLLWEGFYIIRPKHGLADNFPASGLRVGLFSGELEAVAARRGIPHSEVRAVDGAKFTFIGAQLTAGWRSSLEVTLEGFIDGAPGPIKRVVIEPDGPRFVEANFEEVDAVRIRAAGGEDAGLCKSPVCEPGPEVVVDDFTFTFDKPGEVISKAPAEVLLATEKPAPVHEPVDAKPPAVEPKISEPPIAEAAPPAPKPPPKGKPKPKNDKPKKVEAKASPKKAKAKSGPIPEPPVSLSSCPDANFGAQVGAFRSDENASKLRARYEERFGAAQIHVRNAGGAPFYTVVVGCYADRKQAAELRKALGVAEIDNVPVHAPVERLGQFVKP